MRSWNAICGFMDRFRGGPSSMNVPVSADASWSNASSDTGVAAARRRMPAVIGFLGGGVLLPGALRRALDRVRSLERIDFLSQFGNARRGFAAGRGRRCGKPRFELVTQASKLGEIAIVQKRLAQPGLIVSKLGFESG